MAERPVFNQFNMVVSDMSATVTFYRRLGLAISETDPDWAPHHRTVQIPGDIDLDFDSAEFVRVWDKGWSSGPRMGVIGFRVSSREEVDNIYRDLTEAGYSGEQEPYDTFWGPRGCRLAPAGGASGPATSGSSSARWIEPTALDARRGCLFVQPEILLRWHRGLVRRNEPTRTGGLDDQRFLRPRSRWPFVWQERIRPGDIAESTVRWPRWALVGPSRCGQSSAGMVEPTPRRRARLGRSLRAQAETMLACDSSPSTRCCLAAFSVVLHRDLQPEDLSLRGHLQPSGGVGCPADPQSEL